MQNQMQRLGKPNVCNNGGTTSCYKSDTFTLVGQSLMKSDLTIFINGSDKTVSTSVTELVEKYSI